MKRPCNLPLVINKLLLNNYYRDDWIRTSDPFVPNEVRYQAALHPGIVLLAYIEVYHKEREMRV